MLESINTLCVYPFLPLHCPTPERELSPILLKDVVTVHAYLSFNFRTLSINFLPPSITPLPSWDYLKLAN